MVAVTFRAMFVSFRSRLLLAVGAVVVAAVAMTAFFSTVIKPPEKRGPDAVAIWKARTGVDLHALPKLYPAHPDSEEARALDLLVQPLDLHLGGRFADRRRQDDPDEVTSRAIDALRDDLRVAIRATTTEPQPLSPSAVSFIEKHAAILDAVADYVAKHQSIRWRQNFGPRERSSALYTAEHLTLHRLLIGRAFLALDRADTVIAERMLSTSQKLNRALEERQELDSQFIAVGAERLQLALIRRAGSALEVAPKQPMEGLRERYLAGMSSEAALILTNAKRMPLEDGDGGDVLAGTVVRMLAGSRFALASSERVAHEATGVSEIWRSQDGCVELAKERPSPGSMFSGNFHVFDATEAWRRFVVLALDRAITAAVVSGRTSSPCPSVVITVRDDGGMRTVEAKGLPPESDNVIALPSVVMARSKP